MVLTMDLGGWAASGSVMMWQWAAAHMGPAAPLPTPHVGVMGHVSRVSGEGGVPVLTMELRNTGGVRCLGNVGLLRFGGRVAVISHCSGP